MPSPIAIVDVFSEQAFAGNPVAVVTLTEEIATEAMAAITRWFNLSETTFLLPPTDPAADYRVRIFTLERELPFAGHPTLGTCHAWLAAGGVPKDRAMIIQQCGAGLVRVARDTSGALAFAAPPLLREGPVEEALVEEIAGVLGIDRTAIIEAAWVDNGPGWVAVRLASGEAVRALTPVRSHSRRIDLGVVGLEPAGSATAYEVRALFSDAQGALLEDPVTGSLNASLAQWLTGSGLVRTPYLAAQGTCLGRQGRIAVRQDDERQIWIGGATVTRVAGEIEL